MVSIELLKKGNILPAFCLPAASGEVVRLGELRGRRNLVLFLSHPPGCNACEQELRELDSARGELRQEEAEVLAVIPGSSAEVRELKRRLSLSLPLLIDAAPALNGGAAMVVTDRFGEIFAVTRAGKEHQLPTPAQIAEDLAFIGVQCPE
jgi:peroxiredoxin